MMHNDVERLRDMSRQERLRLLLEDSTRYIRLMDETDVDMLLSKLAKTRGLTPEELESGAEAS